MNNADNMLMYSGSKVHAFQKHLIWDAEEEMCRKSLDGIFPINVMMQQ